MKNELMTKTVNIHGQSVVLYSKNGKYWDSDAAALLAITDRVNSIIAGTAPLNDGEGWR